MHAMGGARALLWFCIFQMRTVLGLAIRFARHAAGDFCVRLHYEGRIERFERQHLYVNVRLGNASHAY